MSTWVTFGMTFADESSMSIDSYISVTLTSHEEVSNVVNWLHQPLWDNPIFAPTQRFG
jgi:hypothetical protein